jgi:hypothetical protein
MEEFLKEKMMIDDIVNKINEEDHRERERVMNQKVVISRKCSISDYLLGANSARDRRV